MFGELFSYLSVKIRRVTMSLPGVGDNEQPTILEVLNRGIVDTKEEIVTVTGTESTNNIVAKEELEDVSLNSTIKVTSELEAPQKKKPEEEEEPQENDKESDILVIRNSSSGSQSKWNEPPQRKSQLSEDELQDECGVYDIESHLIETLKNYSVSEDSGTWGVDIKELPPIEGESLHRTSKIETDPSIGTVIEVEPASPKVLKPVEISVPEPQRQSVFLQKESQKEQNSSELKLNKQTNEDTNSEVAQNITETDSFRIKEHLLAQNSLETESSELEEYSGELPDEFEFNSTALNAHLSESQFDDQPIEYSILSTGESTPVIVTDLDSDESVDEVLSESKETENHSLRHKEDQILDYLSSKVDINQNFNVLDQNICNTLNNKTEQKLDSTEEPIVPSSREETTTSRSNRESTDTTQTKIEPTAPDPTTEVEPTSESSSSEVTIKSAIENAKTEDSASLTKEIDQKLSELSTHLSSNSKVDLNGNISKSEAEKLTGERLKEGFDINGLPLPRTAAEEEQRKEFLDSLPQVSLETDSNKVAALAKREYYQSLRQYLITHVDRPPVPPETYRWEDLKRAKQRGGYPWTHLHKRPLGPDEEPEIVLLLRKSQELRFTSESPKSFKKVRIDDQVSIKETERYIQELSDTEENSHTEDEADEDEEEHQDERSECISCVSDSVLTVEKKASKLGKLRGILKKRSPKKEPDSKSLPDTSTVPSTSFTSNNKSAEDVRERPSRLRKEEHHHKAKCFPIMKKLKSMADRQKKNFKNIKKISLKKDEKIPLDEEQKIIRLKTSPKAVHSEIPHFIEKQDSDDVLEIIELDESPSRKRKDQLELQEQASAESSVLVPDEIIDIPTTVEDDFSERQQTPEPTVSEILEEELKSSPVFSGPPKKAARLRREHVYEDIEDTGESVSEEINTILQMASVEALKQSLSNQDNSTLNDMEATKTDLPLERMGSSEEEVEHPKSLLAPLSSIDSASSEEERKPHLSPVAEESDAASVDGVVVAATAAAAAVAEKEAVNNNKLQVATEGAKERIPEHLPWADIELKPVLKKEASPAPSEKKVTFSHVEDEAEPHREDIELPEELRGTGPKRWSNLSDHEYEPIGEPSTEIKKESTPEPPAQVSALKKELSPAPPSSAVPQADQQELSHSEVPQSALDASDETPSKSDELKEAEELQKDLEDRYFNSAATTSQQESQNDYETQTSQMDSSALDDIPMEAENKKKGFMANAQDKTRKMQAGLKNQAGKIKTKFRSQKKAPSGSPKAATRKRFKAPEFSKMKMPEMKRPEFTKFSKPDMSKFKLPDKFSSLKLTRSKSFKEPSEIDDTTVSGTTPESAAATAPPKKQRFDFSFGTYPRAFRKKPKPQVVEESTVDEPSVIQSTETQPSAESSSTPQGDRGPGPVRSRWADKFSDVSYNDSEGSRYRRFESEQDSSFDRESSMERRMKEVLEDNAKEEAELAMLGVVEQKQFADYDEENRVIHEISKIREREFKRRPMVHQDSDLVSEEGRDIGWTQREAEKNQFLRKAELEAESHLKHHTEKEYHPDTQSTASSKRLVFEEIGSDEFLLRKKGASQEFSMGKQKYLDPNLETEYDKSPNPLELIGSQTASLNGSSIDRIDYGYDVPPPKPRRLSQQQRQRHRYDSENASQIDDYGDDISLSQAGSDYFRHAPPARPLRKGRFKNSQDMSIERTPSIQYDEDDYSLRNKNFVEEEKENIQEEQRNESPMPPQQPPQPPRRRRKQLRDSLEKDSYVNGFGGRSVSNSYLREDNKPEEVIVYRTEHEYNIPLATPENYTDTSVTTRKSKSLSRLGIDDDDRTSHGADSLTLDFAMREENDNKNLNAEELHEKYIIEMMENDGYAVVRKENLPKPTPPARRKKFTRSPGERFATMPHQRKASPSLVAEQKISTGNYSTIGRPTPPRRRSATSLTAVSQKDYGSQDFTDYEEPDLDERPESPRNLQSGDIINKMKYRPLPPPPRPPREKRHLYRDRNGGDDNDDIESRDDRDDRDGGGERIAYHELHEQSSDDYNQQQQENVEVEVSTQTDPLPDDFVCEEFEITEDMKIIEPRRTKTLDEILKEEEEAELERSKQIDEEILARGIQRFREASQRSASERSRASSQAKSLSRPQTPSAILIEKRIPTPVPNANGQTVIEASLTVQPIDDLDLEEEILRREGLYDGSHSKSDEESRYKEEEKQSSRAASEEENARVDEEVQSYTRSSDVESQHQEEEERELEMERQREQDIAFEAERRLREEEEKQKRLQEEEEEEANRRLQEEVEADERLLRELEEEQRYLEEALLRHAEKEKELERRIREEEEEEERKRILEEIAIDQRLRPDSQSEEHESYDEDQNERLKSEDSYELKSEVSEEKETTPLPSPSSTQQPPQVEQEVLVSQVKKLLLTTPPKEESQEREKTLSPPPTAPPRKRSTADHTESLSVAEQPAPIPFTGVMPSHLSIADLEVERLRVHALQAGQIMVSHLHGAQIQAEELECRSGNLVVKNIELPPGFIEDIVERVRSTEREHAQASTQTIAEARTQTETDSIPPPPLPSREPEIPPVRPPPPSAAHFLQLQRDQDESPRSVHVTDYHLQTIPPIGFYNHLHAGDDGELAAGPPPVYRRRRHLRRRDSSSEEEHQRRRSRSIRPEQPPQSVAQAGRQFISACSLPLVNIITQLTNALRPNNDNNKDQVQPRNISTAVVLLVVMALSFVIYLLTGRNIHHHHWDYFNPPGNDGRLS
ncbi:titin homolog isoform X3 [Eupeodes corollae]|uniref:titin homolog isoform X3 n=1 Tax=Eupeodes corollae TaxID=290404 RepID=UPI0024904EBC|nr:titin homolog isoform X3 [Eupeodes corollae]XP_055911209.1 titin homolog isoform X3 [Eupeodes corollae]